MGRRRVLLPIWTVLLVQCRPFITSLVNAWPLLLPEDGGAYLARDVIPAIVVGVTELVT